MVEIVDIEFLRTPTSLEDGTWKTQEVMSQTVKAMNDILVRFPMLSWEVFYKIYAQWYELEQLQIEGEIVMFDQFCEATKAILAHPIDVTNPGEFIRTVTFIEDLDKLQNASEVITRFQRYLPHIPQETIDAARDEWKRDIKNLSRNITSFELWEFFNGRRDTEGYYPDLDCLKFFYERASDDSELNEWYERFGKYCRS